MMSFRNLDYIGKGKSMNKQGVLKRARKGIAGYLFILFPLALLLTFNIIPMLFGFGMSFTEWNGIQPAKFIGLDNYKKIFTNDSVFNTAFLNTIKFSITSVVGGITIAFILAILIDRITRFQAFFRVSYFLPVVTPMVVVALIWTLIYQDKGLLNYILSIVGLDSVGWLTDRKIAMYSVVVTSIWQGMGFSMIIFLAALQGIPNHLYEAAKMDGANFFQQVRHVTIPGLKNTFAFLAVYGTIGGFQVFDQIYVMTGGGPVNSTQTIVYWIYSNFKQLNLGYSSALSYVFFMILLIISIIQLKIFQKNNY
ncbi:carbohydrate ABC transporter membrane protein 1 (CUT1 family) [Pseudogracilibacillus auburnensis]|uniref:Carbohydrate ABC transporter membrane protein 1 (CUT1 family) n=2 Tax=Pseudogracilibacillus auburnensis TaxID=1494959 RepID=A0A2V3W6W6_9BACI|nr:carbohydrate ABC transporter membrane protein 1 (CUT1 family) [Pseudogracilibacillus auburnensis]